MAVDTKKYLDLVGLAHYDEKLKAYIKSNGSDVTDKLIALIGAAEKGEDEATILARVAALETAIGDVSELDAEVENLVKAILGEAAARKALDEQLHGKDTESEGASVHTKGELDVIDDRLTALEDDTTDADAIAALEEKLYGTGEGEAHVKGDLDKLQDNIDAEQERAEGAESDLQDAIDAEEAARKAQIGELGKVSEEEGAADHTVKSYVDAAVEAINGDAEALEERVEDLEALHADKVNEAGEVVGKKTVGEEVNEAVVALVNGAPEALDTLKEIADWIAEQGEVDEDGAAQLVSKIEKNKDAIEAEVLRATGAESDLQDAIDAVEEKVDAFVRITEAEIDALFGDVAEEENA